MRGMDARVVVILLVGACRVVILGTVMSPIRARPIAASTFLIPGTTISVSVVLALMSSSDAVYWVRTKGTIQCALPTTCSV